MALNAERRGLRGLLLVALAAGLAACSQAAPTSSAAPTRLTVGLGYLPSVQFAQFYRAQRQGYYRDAGLEVTFQHQIDPQLITLLGQGAVDIGLADGTSVIPAAAQGIPVRYGATVYARFPSVVIAAAEGGIKSAADLRGQRLGIPGRFGSSWIMLQALLASAGLTPADLEIADYPDFGQAVALRQGHVDAATGFANNEPVQLEREGFATNVLRVDDITPLPGPGLTVGEGTLSTKRDALRAFTAATLRAMAEIVADPQLGLDDAIAQVPDLGQDPDGQLAVLRATVEMWHSPYTQAHGLGAIDRDAWQRSIEFMRTLPDSNVPSELTAEQLLTEELIP
jgi:NitT/TauT family transport system substrate-binding protein